MQGSDQELADLQYVDIGDSDTHTRPSLQAALCIERVLHLTLPPSATEAAPSASMTAAACQGNEGQVAVAFEWGGVTYTTPAVAVSHAGSATWQYHAALHVAQAEASCGGNLELAHLRLQVCSQFVCKNTAGKQSIT